jgi:hypothetical protein
MGFTPRQVDEMTLWEFAHCMDGYKASQGIEDAPPVMSDELLAELGIVGFEER